MMPKPAKLALKDETDQKKVGQTRAPKKKDATRAPGQLSLTAFFRRGSGREAGDDKVIEISSDEEGAHDSPRKTVQVDGEVIEIFSDDEVPDHIPIAGSTRTKDGKRPMDDMDDADVDRIAKRFRDDKENVQPRQSVSRNEERARARAEPDSTYRRNREDSFGRTVDNLRPTIVRVIGADVATLAAKRLALQALFERACALGWDDRKLTVEGIRRWRELERLEPIPELDAYEIPMSACIVFASIVADPEGFDVDQLVRDGHLTRHGGPPKLQAEFYIRRATFREGVDPKDALLRYAAAYPADMHYAIVELVRTAGNVAVLDTLPPLFARVKLESTVRELVDAIKSDAGVQQLCTLAAARHMYKHYGGVTLVNDAPGRLADDYEAGQRRYCNFNAANDVDGDDDDVFSWAAFTIPALTFPVRSTLAYRTDFRVLIHESVAICAFSWGCLNSAAPGHAPRYMPDPSLAVVCQRALRKAGAPHPVESPPTEVLDYVEQCYRGEARWAAKRRGTWTISLESLLSSTKFAGELQGAVCGGVIRTRALREITREQCKGASVALGNSGAGASFVQLRWTMGFLYPELDGAADLSEDVVQRTMGGYIDLFRVDSAEDPYLLHAAGMARILCKIRPLVTLVYGRTVAATFEQEVLRDVLKTSNDNESLDAFLRGETPVDSGDLFPPADGELLASFRQDADYRLLQGKPHIVSFGPDDSADLTVAIPCRHMGHLSHKPHLALNRTNVQLVDESVGEVYTRVATRAVLTIGRHPTAEERFGFLLQVDADAQDVCEELWSTGEMYRIDMYEREDVHHFLMLVNKRSTLADIPQRRGPLSYSPKLRALGKPNSSERRDQYDGLVADYQRRERSGAMVDPLSILPAGMDIHAYKKHLLSRAEGTTLYLSANTYGKSPEGRARVLANNVRVGLANTTRGEEHRAGQDAERDTFAEESGILMSAESRRILALAVRVTLDPKFLERPISAVVKNYVPPMNRHLSLRETFRTAVCAECDEVLVACDGNDYHRCPKIDEVVTIVHDSFPATIRRISFPHDVLNDPVLAHALGQSPEELGFVRIKAGEVLAAHPDALPALPGHATLRSYADVEDYLYIPADRLHDEDLKLTMAGDIAIRLLARAPPAFEPKNAEDREIAWGATWTRTLLPTLAKKKHGHLYIMTCSHGYYGLRQGPEPKFQHDCPGLKARRYCKTERYHRVRTFYGLPADVATRIWRYQRLEARDGMVYHTYVD